MALTAGESAKAEPTSEAAPTLKDIITNLERLMFYKWGSAVYADDAIWLGLAAILDALKRLEANPSSSMDAIKEAVQARLDKWYTSSNTPIIEGRAYEDVEILKIIAEIESDATPSKESQK